MPRRNYNRGRNYKYNPVTYVDKKPFIHENENEENGSKQKIFNLLDTGLVIAALTAFGYFIAYAYQKGYWYYYGVTQEFLIQISLVNVLISITATGFGVLLLFTSYQNIVMFTPNSDSPLRKVLMKIFFPVCCIVIGLITLIPSTILQFEIKHILFIAVIILVISYVIPICTQWNVKGYKNKIVKYFEEREKKGDMLENIAFNLKEVPSSKYIYLIILLIICYFVSYAWGYKTAGDKEEYLLFKVEQQDYLVIDNNGDNFIVAPVDLKKKEIKKQFQLIEAKSELSKPLVFEHVQINGGIKVKEQKQY
ncbi:hypothetical protein [Priestia megaterium]|uniref:hypothetical protein n=1 Tax=Priestia megaterium TaxID=1404 RepID=UPI002781B037|nr:hypothetical protein [Priestia megaterium]MDQ0805459.1 hypothetical protein [Priestia megaterium]